MGKKTYYKIKNSIKPIETINTVIRKKLSNSQNIIGKYSTNGGFDIYNKSSLITFEPYFGPLVKLNLSQKINSNKNRSVLILKRVNSESYKLQLYLCIFLILVSVIVIIFQYNSEGLQNTLDYFILPVIFLIYLLVVELVLEITFLGLKKRVDKILTSSKIEHEKLN